MSTEDFPKILRLPRVKELTGLGRSTLYQMTTEGRFPRQVRLDPAGRTVGWVESEVVGWLKGRIAEA